MSNSSHQFMPLPTEENYLAVPSVIHQRKSRPSAARSDYYDEEHEIGSPLTRHTSMKRLNNPIQTRIYNFLERPCGIFCFLYHFTVFVMVIGCLVYSSILTVYVEQSYSILFWIESVLFILFLIEYIVRVWSSGCRSKYRGYRGRLLFMRKIMCMVDLCVIIGYGILICIGITNTQFSIQLVRYVRILQILRFLHVDRRLTSWRLLGLVVYDHRYELIATLYFCFIFLIVVAYLIWLVEKDESKPANEDMFHSFADTLWWAIITMATIGYGDKCPQTYIGKMITSCLCICGVAFWTLPSGIIGSGFALKVQQKKREKQFNRLVPAAASFIQNWWRLVACRRDDTPATWRIYRLEVKRISKLARQSGSTSAINTDHISMNSIRLRTKQNGLNFTTNGLPLEKISWRKIHQAEDLDISHRIAIRMIRVIKYHVARRKFRQAHKPYDFKDIMDENAKGNLKVMYILADIQRRLDQSLGLPKAHPLLSSDKDREPLTLNSKVHRLETRLGSLERQTNRVVSLLEELCHRTSHDGKNATINRNSILAAAAEETTAES